MNYVLTINGVIYVLHSPIKMTVDGSLINRPRTRPREWPFWSKLLKSSLNRVLRNAPFCSVQLFMTDHRARSKNPCRKSAASSVIPRTQSYFSLFILGSVVDVITQVIYFDSSDSLLVWCLFLILDSFFSYYQPTKNKAACGAARSEFLQRKRLKSLYKDYRYIKFSDGISVLEVSQLSV